MIVGGAVAAGGLYYYTSAASTLLSQASGPLGRRKCKFDLRRSIEAGKVLAIFSYFGADDEPDISRYQFYGKFRENRQYGSFWDSVSKDMVNIFRQITHVMIDGKTQGVPYPILYGLGDGTLEVLQDDRIAFSSLVRNPEDKKGTFSKVLDSQSGRPFHKKVRGQEQPYSAPQPIKVGAARPVLVVDASRPAGYQLRARPVQAASLNMSSFDMNTIFEDKSTQEGDARYLKAKFGDSQRVLNGFPSGAPKSSQFSTLVQTMKEMKVMESTGRGAYQETTKSTECSDTDVGY